MAIKFISVFIFFVAFIGCNNPPIQQKNIEETPKFYMIDFEQCMESEQPLLISQLADTVEYVILKTPKKIIITGIRKVVPFNEYIFIRARGYIYQFLKNGQFVRQIGSRGKGPGEYIIATDVAIDPVKKEIIVAGSDQLLFYTMEGVYLYHKNIRVRDFVFSDSLMWTACAPGPWEKYKAVSITKEGDTITYIANDAYGKGSLNGSIQYRVGSTMPATFYKNNDGVYFKGYEDNDTIWRLSGMQAEPYAYINMGKYKLPFEYTAGYSGEGFQKNAHNYFGVPVVAEDNNYFFLWIHSRNIINTKFIYMIYDKNKGKGFIAKDEKGAGITDDILGGPHIQPYWVTGGYYIAVVEGLDLLEKIEEGKYNPSPAFKKQLSTIDENTNQLIILCHKKQN